MNSDAIRRSVRAYYAARFFETFHFTLGIYLIYMTQYLGLSFTQALLLFIVQNVVSILFDLYGGGLADARGRKRSYILGIITCLAAYYIPVLFVRDFTVLLALSAVTGIGWALASNTISSMIADTLDGEKHRFRQVNARSQVLAFIARAAASVIGGLLYLMYAPLPFIAEAAALCIAGGFALAIHEVKQQPDADGRTATARRIVTDALLHIRSKAPIVFWGSLALAFSAYLGGDLLFTYLQPFFSSHGYSAVVLGILFGAISLLSAAGSWTVQYLHHRGWRMEVIAMCSIIIALNGLGIWTDKPAIVLVTVAMQAFVNGMTMPTLRLIVTESAPARIRTAVLSAGTTITSAFMLSGFLLSGLLADNGTPQQAGSLAACFALLGLVIAVRKRQSARMASSSS